MKLRIEEREREGERDERFGAAAERAAKARKGGTLEVFRLSQEERGRERKCERGRKKADAAWGRTE